MVRRVIAFVLAGCVAVGCAGSADPSTLALEAEVSRLEAELAEARQDGNRAVAVEPSQVDVSKADQQSGDGEAVAVEPSQGDVSEADQQSGDGEALAVEPSQGDVSEADQQSGDGEPVAVEISPPDSTDEVDLAPTVGDQDEADSRVDADGDGVKDALDACVGGQTGWSSNQSTDLDGDGCRDRERLVAWSADGEWELLATEFELESGQHFDIHVTCDNQCPFETAVRLRKPDGTVIVWGSDGASSEGGFREFIVGNLSGISGYDWNADAPFGDFRARGGWSEPGTYRIEATDALVHDDKLGNGGMSLVVYLVDGGLGEDVDADGDGINDLEDRCLFGETDWISSTSTDSEGDGCRDADEDMDDDDDGLLDFADTCPLIAADPPPGSASAEYPLDDDLKEADGEIPPAVVGRPTLDTGTGFLTGSAAFVVSDGVRSLRLDGLDGLRLPLDLSAALDPSDGMEVGFQFNLGDDYLAGGYDGHEGSGERVLVSNQHWVSQDGIGFSIVVAGCEGDDDEIPRCLYAYLDDDAQYTEGHRRVISRQLEYGRWYDLRVTLRLGLEVPTMEVLFDRTIQTIPLSRHRDTGCTIQEITQEHLYIGSDRQFSTEWHRIQDSTELAHIQMFVSDLYVNSPTSPGDAEAARASLRAFTGQLSGSNPISAADLDAHLGTFLKQWRGQWAELRPDVLDFVATYEAVRGPVFDMDPWVPDGDEPLRYVAYLLKQWIHDRGFSPEHIETVAGTVFEEAEEFPGLVASDARRVPSVAVAVRGTYRTDPGYWLNDQEVLRQPVGYWAPAGELVTIRVDPRVVGHGLGVLVGAHQSDLEYSFTEFKRFPRVGRVTEITSVETVVGSPFGGGLYITVPDGTDLGMVEVTIEGAISSPLFSTRSFDRTSIEDWRRQVRESSAPWVDIVSDKFMTSLPLGMVEKTVRYACREGRFGYWGEDQGHRSCSAVNPAGSTLVVEAAIHDDFGGFSMRVVRPDGSTTTAGVGALVGIEGVQTWTASFDEPGLYTIELPHGRSELRVSTVYDTVLDPTEMLEGWDAAMNAFMVIGGRPTERTHPMWLLPDVQTGHAGTAAPAANPMVMEAPVWHYERDQRWWADPRQVMDFEFWKSSLHVVFHEWGHLSSYPMFEGEGESIVNLPAAAVYDLAFGLSLDEAQRYSTNQEFDRDQSAIDWMVSSVFRDGERIGGQKGEYSEEGYPLDQVSYQARGHSKYVDLAYLFGWEAVGAFHRPFYERGLAGEEDDNGRPVVFPHDFDLIYTGSTGVGVNLAPLLEFWGIIPIPYVLDQVASLPRPIEIRDLLLEYRDIVPKDQREFIAWHDSVVDTIRDWQGPQVASYRETYDAATGAAAVARIDHLLCKYYAENCELVGGEPFYDR